MLNHIFIMFALLNRVVWYGITEGFEGVPQKRCDDDDYPYDGER